MDLTIKAQARGAWGVVIGPTLAFLLIWALPAAGVYLLVPSASGLAYGVAVALGLPLAGLGSVGVHRACFSQSKGREVNLVLQQDRLQWRRHCIDLNQSHRATLRLDSGQGSGALSMELRVGKRVLQLFAPSMDLQRTRSIFPEGGFLLDGALGPEQGAPAWVIDAEDALQILSVLWRQRQQNALYQFYRRFPWDHPSAGSSAAEYCLPFESPAVQTDLARAIWSPKPKEIWLTAGALLFREGPQVCSLPLGVYRLEPESCGDSALRWFTFGAKHFWLDPYGDLAEVDLFLRYVNRR